MTETTAAPESKPTVFSRTVMHLRASGGSTYGVELLGADKNVIGYLSSWVGTGKNSGQERRVYTLNLDNGENLETTTYEEFLAAYTKQLEERKRDAEWNAAAPKEPVP